jgi:DNA (cytosine-5)-methyltransferase 1
LRDFARLREGENSAIAMRERGIMFEFPYDKSCFKDRYTRQSRWHPCSTIVAHLSKDGLMFIHPTQNRSLTPREAARVQSFPDWFRFPKARTPAFRLIGNAVPPLVAEAVGLAVKEFLESPSSNRERIEENRAMRQLAGVEKDVPQARQAAACELQRLASLDRRALRALPTETFLQGWRALIFLFPDLHPDNALDHGSQIEEVSPNQLALPGFDALVSRRYSRSGWPVALELIGNEAWRRFNAGELAQPDFYCVEAQRTGLRSSTESQIREIVKETEA